MRVDTKEVVRRQLRALGNDRFELGIQHRDSGAMDLRILSAEKVLGLVGFLKWKNQSAHFIRIRPKWPHPFVFIDDLSVEGVYALDRRGFAPSVVVESSPENFQAWLNLGRRVGTEVMTVIARQVASTLDADQGAANWRQAGALAGFTNCHTHRTMRVLRAASDAGVERVVLTSSISAVCEGYPRDASRVFTEDDWSNLEGELSAYDKSKTLAERAAWDFVQSLPADRPLELSVINPALVLGPLLEPDYSVSVEAIRKLMRKEYPGVPRLGWQTVDVRDVASAHVAAMTTPEAAGQRFICGVDFVWMKEMAEILTRNFASEGYELPTRTLPNFVVRLAALFDRVTAVVVPRLGLELHLSNEKIKRVLGWEPRETEEQIVSAGRSLIDLGVV